MCPSRAALALPLTLLAVPPAHAQRQAFEAWGLAYTLPAGWQVAQQFGRVHGLTTGTPGSVLYVAPGMYQSFTEVAVDVNKGFQALGATGTATGQPQASTVRGMQAMTATYVGQNPMGVTFQARVTAILTSHGTGLIVTGIAPAEQMAPVAEAVDRVARSLEVVGAPRPNTQAIAALRGRWMLYAGRADGTTSASGGSSRSYEEFVEFDGTGRFAWQSSASVMVTTPGYTGSAGGAQATNDEGTYTVVGSTLVAHGRQGQANFELQILGDRIVADGRTYVRAN
jgi:hypothetical protein